MNESYYIGLMSGTSLDGVDAVLVAFSAYHNLRIVNACHVALPAQLRQPLLALNTQSTNELEHSALLANALAHVYADAVHRVLQPHPELATKIAAIGNHGQTIRHRPELGFTIQIGNASLLAELTGIKVISDFRSRDIAAGGQGAPLVPAFHHAVFAHPTHHRVVVNIGGFSNLTYLSPKQEVSGFDCGPGNALMDGWIQEHLGLAYDAEGNWASQGVVIPRLLQSLLAHPFISAPPPKSTGRDTFHLAWLKSLLQPGDQPVDVQATLLECTVQSIKDSILQYCPQTHEIYVCGGGARNLALLTRLRQQLPAVSIDTTALLGIEVDLVEATAFAWLAHQTLLNKPGNLPSVTGAAGPRILGAIYPA